MRIKTIKNLNLKGATVFLRVDFNEPVNNKGELLDDFRIKSTLPTFKFLLENNCKIVVGTHIGRPEGKVVETLRTDAVAEKIGELLDTEVLKLDKCVSNEVQSEIRSQGSKKIIMLENLRFHEGEEKNDSKFAEELSKLAEIYVNDAFANCHREHASMTGILRFLPGCIGFLVEKELSELDKFLKNVQRPFTFVLGGAKLETKMKLLKKFLTKADNVLLGGKVANTSLKATGVDVGASEVEGKMLSECATLIPKISESKLYLPVDVSVARSKDSREAKNVFVKQIPKDEIVFDIGVRTRQIYGKIIKESKTILFNGPMGYIENKIFQQGTREIANAMTKADAWTIAGGGETVDLLGDLDLRDKFSFVSTGGGAMLDYLENEKLIAIDKLIEQQNKA